MNRLEHKRLVFRSCGDEAEKASVGDHGCRLGAQILPEIRLNALPKILCFPHVDNSIGGISDDVNSRRRRELLKRSFLKRQAI